MDKFATIIRYLITYIFAPIAAKKGLDAVATGHMVDAIYALIAALVTVAPLVYNLFTRPSSSAMKVAIAADEVMKTGDIQAVATPIGVPDLKVVPVAASRGGQG